MKRLSVSQSVCPSVRPSVPFVCPRGTNISNTQERGGQTFVTPWRDGGTNIFHSQGGGQTFFVGCGGGYDDVDEVMNVSEANILASEASIFVSEASKLSGRARIFRGP